MFNDKFNLSYFLFLINQTKRVAIMNSGEFRYLIQVMERQPTGNKNILDEDILGYKEIARFWGKFENRTGCMLYGRAADTKLAKTTHKITYRYMNYPELSIKHIIKIDNTLYNIEYIDDLDNRHEVMEVFVINQA